MKSFTKDWSANVTRIRENIESWMKKEQDDKHINEEFIGDLKKDDITFKDEDNLESENNKSYIDFPFYMGISMNTIDETERSRCDRMIERLFSSNPYITEFSPLNKREAIGYVILVGFSHRMTTFGQLFRFIDGITRNIFNIIKTYTEVRMCSGTNNRNRLVYSFSDSQFLRDILYERPVVHSIETGKILMRFINVSKSMFPERTLYQFDIVHQIESFFNINITISNKTGDY